MNVKIKASGINNLSDARYFSAFGVEWMGFNCHPNHTNYIPLEDLNPIAGWVFGPRLVLECEGLTKEEILHNASETGIKLVQIDDASLIDDLEDEIESFILAVSISSPEEISSIIEMIEDHKNQIAQFLIRIDVTGKDWISNYKQTKNDWKSLCLDTAVILEFNFEASDLQFLDQEIQPFGVSIVGGNEISLGLRSFDDLADIMEALTED